MTQFHFQGLRFNREVALRLAADTVMVATAFLGGFMVYFMWLVFIEERLIGKKVLLADFLGAYTHSVWLIITLSLIVFAASGFYTRGRAYRSRYKVLVVAQGVTLSYILFGFIAFLFQHMIVLPHTALLLAWLFTIVLLVSARVWSMLWEKLAAVERLLVTTEPSKALPQQVLVIGGAGYIGSALLPKLLENGYHVRLLDLLLFGTEPIAEVLDHPNLEIIRADFRHVNTVVKAMHGVDTVIHLGAIVGDPACALDEELTIEVNVMATRMIAEVAKGSGVTRFIFASTCSVYGTSDHILDEYSALNPVSLYARSKIASERVLMSIAGDYFTPVIVRFGTIYGLSGRTRFDLVVNLLTAKAIKEGQITVVGGDQWRPFLHVDDAARAVFAILAAPDSLVGRQIFNVGSDAQNYTIRQVSEIIRRFVPTAQLVTMGDDVDKRNYRVSFSKIRNLLGFVPQWTLDQGVQQVIDAINREKIHDYQAAQYSNVKFLRAENIARLIRAENHWVDELLSETATEPVMRDQPSTAESLKLKAVGS